MFALDLNLGKKTARLPNHVHDVTSAGCVFCPYGAEVRVGDRVYAFDEKTSLDRRQRERLVEVTAVRKFRSTGRLITLDLKIANEAEILRIAVDSEITVGMLYDHRSGASTYIDERPPVVVYFKPCNEDDTVGSPFKQHSRRPRPHLRRRSG